MTAELTEAEQLRRELVAEKRAQAVGLLNRHGIDCWLTFAREGSDLMLPFVMGSQGIVGVSAQMIFADGGSVAIVADYDAGQVDGLFDRVIPYSLDWKEPLRETLRERNPARIGLNFSQEDHGIDGLTHGLYLALVATLSPLGFGDRLVSAAPVAERVRTSKTPAEVERMRRACSVTQRIFDDLTGMLRPGLTEADIFEIVVERMETYEVEPAWEAAYCPTVATTRSRMGHNPPGATKLEPGDGLRVDLGVKVDDYCSDLQRTWYLRRPGEADAPDDYKHAFATVRDGIRLAADLLKPGMRGIDVDKPVRDFVAAGGFTFTHALGHQLGRLAHDGGLLLGPDNARYASRSKGIVEAGMVFTLEPCTGGISLEENVVVTETGCEYLVAPQDELYLI